MQAEWELEPGNQLFVTVGRKRIEVAEKGISREGRALRELIRRQSKSGSAVGGNNGSSGPKVMIFTLSLIRVQVCDLTRELGQNGLR
jgi:hypothetical protein